MKTARSFASKNASTIAGVTFMAAVVGCTFLQPKTQSPFSGQKVTQRQLDVEWQTFAAAKKAEVAEGGRLYKVSSADIEAQQYAMQDTISALGVGAGLLPPPYGDALSGLFTAAGALALGKGAFTTARGVARKLKPAKPVKKTRKPARVAP